METNQEEKKTLDVLIKECISVSSENKDKLDTLIKLLEAELTARDEIGQKAIKEGEEFVTKLQTAIQQRTTQVQKQLTELKDEKLQLQGYLSLLKALQ